MKNECSIVRDVLPLYVEAMVSEETAAFVNEHLETCSACAAEFEAMKAGGPIDEAAVPQRETDANVITGLKKRIRKQNWTAVLITAACLLTVVTLLHSFPVYRIAVVGGTSYFSSDELAKLAYIGSGADRAEAQSVLRQADAAFRDCEHTSAENEERYGVLSRYATATDLWNDLSFTNYSLTLWSAHLGAADGYLWVHYSRETFDREGNIVTGSWNIPSLWKVEKDDTGAWVVVQIKEHP